MRVEHNSILKPDNCLICCVFGVFRPCLIVVLIHLSSQSLYFVFFFCRILSLVQVLDTYAEFGWFRTCSGQKWSRREADVNGPINLGVDWSVQFSRVNEFFFRELLERSVKFTDWPVQPLTKSFTFKIFCRRTIEKLEILLYLLFKLN